MFRFSQEGSGPEELERIRDPYAAFQEAYQAAVEAVDKEKDELFMTEKLRNADAAARLIEDATKRGEALQQVVALEARSRFGPDTGKQKSPGGAGFDDPLESGKM